MPTENNSLNETKVMVVKTNKLVAAALLWLPGLMMALSAIAKFMKNKTIVDNLTRVGFLPRFPLPALAVLDLLCVALLLIPKTFRLGLLMITGYLGGALSIEISEGVPPIAGILLIFIWIATYIKDKTILGLTLKA
jgi:hypothetical protein